VTKFSGWLQGASEMVSGAIWISWVGGGESWHFSFMVASADETWLVFGSRPALAYSLG